MSCEKCREALIIDDVEPPCFNNCCWIPDLDDTGRRIMEIRSRLISLREIVDAGTICTLYDVNLEDLEMLAVVENELKAMTDGKNNG